MFCSNCGTSYPEGAANCPSCNQPRPDAAAPVAATAPNTPPAAPGYPPAGYPVPQPGQSNFTKFLNFETMVTPMIMKIIYIVGTALIALGTLIAMFSSFAGVGLIGVGAAMFSFFVSIVAGAVAIVFFRVICESLMVYFSIHKELVEVKKNTKK